MVIGRHRGTFAFAVLRSSNTCPDNDGSDIIGVATGDVADVTLVVDTRLSDLGGIGGGCGIDTGR